MNHIQKLPKDSSAYQAYILEYILDSNLDNYTILQI